MMRLFSGNAARRYFAGTWLLTRKVIDRRAGLIGDLTGEAHFHPGLQGFDYRESGLMRYGGYEGQASQSYRWEVEDDRLTIRFTDGRLFHQLDLASGAAVVEHLCAADLYRGRFRLINADCWLSRWHVRGPRKDQIILSRYRRK